ncbi:MAG TPA: efflux RND transporter periplasmic adaptor subunit [Burkholderiales bacterium]|nr:efflux RND transporter periplasmic adaptor subunit [Burkholderiales bacterium]
MNDSDAPAQAPALRAGVRGANGRRRARALLTILSLAAIAGLSTAGYWFAYGRYHESTDNAYVGGNVVQVTPQVAGTVVSINADDTQFVRQGAPLVQLDPADYQVQLSAAEAELADAVRSVRGLYANSDQARASLVASEAELQRQRYEVARAQAEADRARAEYRRREELAAQGFVSPENVQNAKAALDAAAAQLDGAKAAVDQAQAAIVRSREQLRAAAGLVDNVSAQSHPRVLTAASKVKEAYLAMARSTVPAPTSGYVAKRAVQVGQRVSPGTALMAVIPAEQLWVDANFKEGQLENVRIGQPVSLTADLYGGGVVYHGRVVGLAAGTGSAFSLLPAQNATGNWIKIVQRLPVRIALDPAELAAHPLRIGLSMRATVDTHDRSGDVLARKPAEGPAYATDVYAEQAQAADALIDKIILANLARPHP